MDAFGPRLFKAKIAKILLAVEGRFEGTRRTGV